MEGLKLNERSTNLSESNFFYKNQFYKAFKDLRTNNAFCEI